MILKNDIKKYCITEDTTIIEALKVISAGEERTCFVVDESLRLLQVITDGDIRRALIRGVALDSKVKYVHDRTPYILKEGQNIEDAKNFFSKRISVVPIVNNENILKGFVQFHDIDKFIDIKSRKILILGLGYVGITLAVILADCGFIVYGYDSDEELIKTLKSKKSQFYEKGIENYLYKHVGNNLKLLSSLDDDFSADIHIITVGTPIIKETLEPNINHIRSGVSSVAKILKKNDLVILRSTVPLGTTRNVVLPLLEECSGLKADNDFFLAYCPERTAEGRALKELLTVPQIVGGYNYRSTELASRLFNENTHTVIDVNTLESAEMCKLLDNTFRDTMFAYSNLLGGLCEKAGLNINQLIDSVNLGYSRNRIPKPSPGVGGACLSKDPYILISNFKEFDLDYSFIKEARKINEAAPKSIYNRSTELLKSVNKDLENAKVFIMGFAFKGDPETSDLRDSTTLWFLDELKNNNVKNIWGYDAIVTDEKLRELEVKPCEISEGFKDADAVYIMNNSKAYADLHVFELLETMKKPALFFDGWHFFRPSDIKSVPGIMYAGVGVK